jgi:hypothetical protein
MIEFSSLTGRYARRRKPVLPGQNQDHLFTPRSRAPWTDASTSPVNNRLAAANGGRAGGHARGSERALDGDSTR